MLLLFRQVGERNLHRKVVVQRRESKEQLLVRIPSPHEGVKLYFTLFGLGAHYYYFEEISSDDVPRLSFIVAFVNGAEACYYSLFVEFEKAEGERLEWGLSFTSTPSTEDYQPCGRWISSP